MKDERARDQAMEKLIRDELRAPSGRAATACPDAEVLAAYVERKLAPSELATCETHLASCAGCREQVAAVVRLGEADEPAEAAAAVAADRAGRRRLLGFRWALAAPALVAFMVAGLWYTGEFRSRLRQSEVRVAKDIPAPPISVESQPPAGAAGGSSEGLDATPHASPSADELKQSESVIARGTPSSAPKPPTSPPAARQANERRELAYRTRAAAPLPAVSELSKRAEGAAATGEREGLRRAEPAITGAMALPSERGRLTAHQSVAAQRSGQDREAQLAAKEEGEAIPAERKDEAPPEARTAPEAEADKVGETQAKLGDKAPAAATAPTRSKRFSTLAAEGSFSLAPSPGWRVGARGLIQKADSKGQWVSQASGLDADLNDIAFATPTIGWVVGKVGTVLRTTDKGKTWSRISIPTSEELIRVTPSGEWRARVVTRGGKVWLTSDAGKTWNPSSEP